MGGFTNEPAAGVVSAECAAEGTGVDGGDAAGAAVEIPHRRFPI